MAESTPPTNSIDVVFDLMKGRLDHQSGQIGILDGKANFALGSASLLTAGVVALHGSLTAAKLALVAAQKSSQVPPPATDLGLKNWVFFQASPYTVANALTVIAILTYIGVILCALRAYQLRRYTVVPEPRELIDNYLGDGESRPDQLPEYTKERVARTLCDAFYENVPRIDEKIRWTTRAIWSLAAEAVVLVLLTLAQIRI